MDASLELLGCHELEARSGIALDQSIGVLNATNAHARSIDCEASSLGMAL